MVSQLTSLGRVSENIAVEKKDWGGKVVMAEIHSQKDENSQTKKYNVRDKSVVGWSVVSMTF